MFIDSVGTGPDVVLVHGWGWHGGIWDDVVKRLALDYRVWVPDLPGHGRSRTNTELSLNSIADAVAARVPSAIWIGWSLGGLLALNAALRKKVQRLVLIGTTPRFLQSNDWSCGLSREWFSEFSSEVDSDAGHALERFASLHLAGIGSERPLLRRLRAELARYELPEINSLRTGLKLLQETDMRPSLSEINAPALIWHGANDQIASVEAGEYLAQQLSLAKFVRVKNAGHAPFLSNADEFENSVRNFLRE